jgi:hypothetical protein
MYSYGPGHVKQHNIQFLKRILKEERQPMTKNQLSKQSGLSVVTINKLIPEMVESGQVLEMTNPIVTGGRRAAVYQLNQNHQLCLVMLYIEEDKEIKTHVSVVNLYGDRLACEEDILQLTEWASIESCIQSYCCKFPNIKMISIGLPGVDMSSNLTVVDPETMKGIVLHQKIEERFALPVIIENDINAAVFGYKYTKANPDSTIVSGLYFPEHYPPGTALVFDDYIYHGSNGLSGETKHLPVFNDLTFPLSEKSDIMYICEQIIQTIITMYDPNELILYTKASVMRRIELETIKENLPLVFSYGKEVVITNSEDFQDDYYQGLVLLGIKELEMQDYTFKNK